MTGATTKASADTPLMQQWREVKSRHPDALVFFRVGDFYELFFGDAQEGARILGLTLTSRNNGSASEVPLAGVPVKALDEYLGRLVQAGRRVAICEQVEDPSEAKGIVRREVVETVTPGTVLHDRLLDAGRNNFVVAIRSSDVEGADSAAFQLAALDLSTGELFLTSVSREELTTELGRLEPTELLLPRAWDVDAPEESAPATFEELDGPVRTFRDDWLFDRATAEEEILRSYGIQSLDAFGLGPEDDGLVGVAGALIAYVHEIQPAASSHLRPPRILRSGSAMALDEMTRRNLELVTSLRPGFEGGTLLHVLDHTSTAMGARMLRRWVLRPLVSPEEIWSRQAGVAELVDDPLRRRAVRECLDEITDLERLAAKISSGRVTPREVAALGRSLATLPTLRSALSPAESDAPESDVIRALRDDVDPMEEVCDRVTSAIASDPPVSLNDGGVIREGYDAELDELRAVRDGARDFIAGLQTRERERTGIGSLKVGFNKVFGYYLEVTRANLDKVPEDFIRKQTLAGAERYFTAELKEWEEKVFGADEKIRRLEAELFTALRSEVAAETPRLQRTADAVAQIDTLATFAEVAERQQYVRPEVHTGFELEVVQGRHPVVETMMPRESFIPNDIVLDDGGRIAILTGPNMAGKSTILRQIGLIQLLAQMGSYVPADRARVPVCDRIYTRVGASDNLARGQSTFMVEMNETAAILHGATDRSLVLLDEIGRGTSTYDGVSIAWAVTEFVHERIGAKTVFATHYHELTQLGDLLPAAKNLNVAVRESGDDVVFLRRLEEGGADRSYGIQVARLAGVPVEVIARAREILSELEGSHTGGGEGLGRSKPFRPESEAPPEQLSIFGATHPVVEELKELEVERMTPIEALNRLAELQRKVRDE